MTAGVGQTCGSSGRCPAFGASQTFATGTRTEADPLCAKLALTSRNESAKVASTRRRLKAPAAAADQAAVRLALLVALVALLAAGAASAATPAAYRAQVNGICRTYTPTVKKLGAQMRQAAAAKDYRSYGIALGELLILNLTQDRRVEAVAVPPALEPQMTPILARLRKIDTHARLALQSAQKGDAAALGAELTTIDKLAKPLNAALDKAGLRDCGSNQS